MTEDDSYANLAPSIKIRKLRSMIKISTIDSGGVTSAKGFKAAGIHAGFRRNTSKPDLALVVADEPCATAATFTQNVFCAAPVRFSKSQLAHSSGNPSYGCAQTIAINSGNANAATGDAGDAVCEEEAALVADAVNCAKDEVLIASTGVIGVQLPMAPFETGLPCAVAALSESGGHDAARAIMTTDTCTKECAVSFDATEAGLPTTITVGGMAKGSGMIMPNMATMISVVTTDAPVKADVLYRILKTAVNKSFNKVTVDSDTSTNDTCFMLASGKAVAPEAEHIEPDTPAYDALLTATIAVCESLAKQMARDGEGATKLVNVHVSGAATEADADMCARTIANSPLVKTAIAGHDANWGRIAAAAGRSGAKFQQNNVNISILGIPVCQGGLALVFDEDEALRRFELPEIDIDIDLGAGDFETTIWTCDLTHDYISINADYRT